MTKREHERAIFEAFLRVLPEFAGETVQEWRQPCDEFPDVICTSSSGKRIGVELGEWLNEEEIRTAKSMERIQDSILEAIGKQGDNRTENIYFVWLEPKAKARVKPKEKNYFRQQLFQFIKEVDKRWPSERFWHSPQGYEAKGGDLKRYPLLMKYLNAIHLFPRMWYHGWPPNGYLKKRTWPPGHDWIIFPARGGAYSEDTMLQSLFELLAQKQEHYSKSGTGFDRLCLIIYYNAAMLYCSPVETPHFKFEDAVQAAKQFIGDDASPFNDIFLFVAIDSGRVFRIV